MAEETDVIRHQIDATRVSLTDKLETLEGQVKDAVGTVSETIETVKSTVENTVENVKSSVHETVDSVKETFDLPRQIDRHPWGALGCSLLAGAALGYLLEPSRSRRIDRRGGIPGMDGIIPGYGSGARTEPTRQRLHAETPRPGILSSLLETLEAEFDQIKHVAIGVAVGMARDALKDALPESLSEHVHSILDDATRRIGGEPIRGRVLASEERGQTDQL
jgi:uncharacterized protein YjbJ (UPF0337 family)